MLVPCLDFLAFIPNTSLGQSGLRLDPVHKLRAQFEPQIGALAVPFGVLTPGMVVGVPVPQSAVAVEALHTVSNTCAKVKKKTLKKVLIKHH